MKIFSKENTTEVLVASGAAAVTLALSPAAALLELFAGLRLGGCAVGAIPAVAVYLCFALPMPALARLFGLGDLKYILILPWGIAAAAVGDLCGVSVAHAAGAVEWSTLIVAGAVLYFDARAAVYQRVKLAGGLRSAALYFELCCVISAVLALSGVAASMIRGFMCIYPAVIWGFVLFCFCDNLAASRGRDRNAAAAAVYERSFDSVSRLARVASEEPEAAYAAAAECLREFAEVACRACGRQLRCRVSAWDSSGRETVYPRGAESTCVVVGEDLNLSLGGEAGASLRADGELPAYLRRSAEAVRRITEAAAEAEPEARRREVYTRLARLVEPDSAPGDTHGDRVAEYTGRLLEQLGYPREVCDFVAGAAAVHDIGKLAIPEEIVGKRGLMSAAERAIMSRHTEYGQRMLQSADSPFMALASEIAGRHHDRYRDARGETTETDRFVQVVTVADVFDALTARRSYKEPWSVAAAMGYMRRGAGDRFAPDVVAALEALF